MKKPAIDHVAILVADIDKTMSAWSLETTNKFDEFADIGTKELYVGKESSSQQLLLMQAIGPGPYQDAFLKRGAGLHHIGMNVPDLEAFLPTIETSGWLVHPKSLRFYKSMKQIYLCRPEVPVLIELGEGDTSSGPKFIERVTLNLPAKHRRLFDIFDTTCFEFSDTVTSICISGQDLCLSELRALSEGTK